MIEHVMALPTEKSNKIIQDVIEYKNKKFINKNYLANV